MADFGYSFVTKVHDLFFIIINPTFILPHKNMIKFMFGQPIIEICFVNKVKYFFYRCFKTQLFFQSSPGSSGCFFLRKGVTTQALVHSPPL